jgi:hypothetical protein
MNLIVVKCMHKAMLCVIVATHMNDSGIPPIIFMILIPVGQVAQIVICQKASIWLLIPVGIIVSEFPDLI